MKKTIIIDRTQYIKKCKYCNSKFIYDIEELVGRYSYDDNKRLSCPNCGNVNKIYFKKIYKGNDEVVKNYDKEIEKLKSEKKEKENDIQDLKYKLQENEQLTKNTNQYYEDKLGKLKTYVNNLLNNNVNNLAKKYLKEIDYIIKGDDK
mgnify:CR=1 FL=1